MSRIKSVTITGCIVLMLGAILWTICVMDGRYTEWVLGVLALPTAVVFVKTLERWVRG